MFFNQIFTQQNIEKYAVAKFEQHINSHQNK